VAQSALPADFAKIPRIAKRRELRSNPPERNLCATYAKGPLLEAAVNQRPEIEYIQGLWVGLQDKYVRRRCC